MNQTVHELSELNECDGEDLFGGLDTKKQPKVSCF